MWLAVQTEKQKYQLEEVIRDKLAYILEAKVRPLGGFKRAAPSVNYCQQLCKLLSNYLWTSVQLFVKWLQGWLVLLLLKCVAPNKDDG